MLNHGKGSGWALWFVGLPGCGKSTIAGSVATALEQQGLDVVHHQMDQRRKVYFPTPSYSPEERTQAYALFVDEAAAMVASGKGVLMDAAAHRVAMRERARAVIARFAEIQVDCSLETARKREANRPEGLVMADLYAKALERKRTGRQFENLGQVIGVDVPFEPNPRAELVLDSETLSVEEARDAVLEFLGSWLGWEHEPAT
ncbi:MAG: adenylyl-sulfate kinase [Desulfohalobiaceae bacterium]